MEFGGGILETFGENDSSARHTGSSPRINGRGNLVFSEDDNYQLSNDDRLCNLCKDIFTLFLKSNYFISILLIIQVICAANLIE